MGGWHDTDPSALCPQVHVEVSSEEYVVFGVVLFLWELVPTTFVVLFFRAQRLSQNLVGLSPCAGRVPGMTFWECFASGLTPFSLADSSRDGQQPQLQLQGLFL